MKPDLYTKAVLTVIAIMLTAIVCNQYIRYIRPSTTVEPQASPFAGVQLSGGNAPSVFDPRTGEVAFFYDTSGEKNGQVYERLKLTKAGSNLTVICGGAAVPDCTNK